MFYGKEKKPQILLYTEIDSKIHLIFLQDYSSQVFHPFQFVATNRSSNPKFYGLELFFQRLLMLRETEADDKFGYLPCFYKPQRVPYNPCNFQFAQTDCFADQNGNRTLIVKMDFPKDSSFDKISNKFFLFQDYAKEEFSNCYNRSDLIDHDPVPQGDCSTQLTLRFVLLDSLQIQSGVRYSDFESHVVEAICHFKQQFEPPAPYISRSPITSLFFNAANKLITRIVNGNGRNNGSPGMPGSSYN